MGFACVVLSLSRRLRSLRVPELTIGLVVAVTAAGLPALLPRQEAPIPVSAAAPATQTAVSADALPTAQIDGVAWSQVVSGNTVFVGGKFQTARPAGSAPGVNTVARKNLLAYDITTGKLTSLPRA